MRRCFYLSLIALPLAACNSGGPIVTATNASGAEVSAKVAAATGNGEMVQPGRWEGTTVIADMKMPLLPADQQASLAGKMGKPDKLVSCVTPEEAKANKAFFTGSDDKSCKYDHFTMSGGKLDAAMSCAQADGKMSATLTGTYSATSYHMTMASSTEGRKDNPYGTMSMKVTVDAQRVGECRGTESKE
jgi:hypothetical protein